ncbi:hypothetical protein MNEG_16541 [Monoraphidium neglectum]|uniref:SPX domain-containing protein n=1 Tax=Monoraphidium neglectum TaxID=145388 RepID=A0A0D2K5H0_9CHLO|nr:hypothetical protein MNEG_16541 [Monoraphidium neglectum]KIY91423.1 hypothetical protein MNEG_16541 [Monoraphidium neglectum]|eukprot:XP_013890443.1 hypothetical protein MNEG_16541 [Monoraphidium neglectum]
MKFAHFLEENRRAEWAEHYVDYRLLKKRLKAVGASLDGGGAHMEHWPTSASLSVARGGSEASLAGLASASTQEEAFLVALQQQIARVAAFTERTSEALRASLRELRAGAPALARAAPAALRGEARRLGDEVLELERFIQLNQGSQV